MTIDEAKKVFDFIANTYEKAGNVNGDEFTMLFNVAQTNYYDSLIGHVEQYQYGRPVPRIGMNMTESISTKLSPFLKSDSSLAVSSGSANKPEGFGRLVAMRTSANKAVDRVEHDKVHSRANSSVIPPSTNPFYVEYADTWKIYPDTLSTVSVEYYPEKPDSVLWKYEESGGREVYVSEGSAHPKWKDYDTLAIIARMLQAASVPVDDAMVLQYSQKIIQTGE